MKLAIKFPRFSYTATFRQSVTTFSGVWINGLLGIVFYMVSARHLGPNSYGQMVIAIATLTLLADVSDLGTNTGIVRFVGSNLSKDKKNAYRYLKLSLKIKLIIGASVAVIGYVTAPWISGYVFGKNDLLVPLRLAFIGAGTAMLFSFTTSTLQALQKFFLWSIVQLGANTMRLVLLFLAALFSVFTLETNLVIYILVPFIGFLVAMLLFLPRDFLKVKDDKSIAKQFFKYNKWVALVTLIAAVSSRIDTFLVARYLSVGDIGVYGAANQLAQVVPQIVGALGVVMAPKMASITNDSEFRIYLKKSLMMVSGIACLLLVCGLVGSMFIPLLYGGLYMSSIPLFLLLLCAMLLFLISVPFHTAIYYYFSYPKLFLGISIFNLLVIAIAGLYLVPQYGATGVAIAVILGQAVNFAIPAFWVSWKVREQ